MPFIFWVWWVKLGVTRRLASPRWSTCGGYPHLKALWKVPRLVSLRWQLSCLSLPGHPNLAQLLVVKIKLPVSFFSRALSRSTFPLEMATLAYSSAQVRHMNQIRRWASNSYTCSPPSSGLTMRAKRSKLYGNAVDIANLMPGSTSISTTRSWTSPPPTGFVHVRAAAL